MGTVSATTLLRDDGTVETIDASRSSQGASGRLSLQYDYQSELLPHAGTADEGMWRYRDLLPIEDGPIRYPLKVGGTPLVAPGPLRRVTGVPNLYLKDETRSPTGSNKDRATALVLEHALRHGVTAVAAASTGNVAVSLSVGAGAAGVRAVVFVPAQVSDAKLTVMLLAGATVIKVEDGYDAAFHLSETAAAVLGWYSRNTGVNPMTLEGKKTVAFEIWEQLGREIPDAVLVPVGDGPTLSALAKGFREIMACGRADRVPRLVGVQAEGCQPLKLAWERGGAIEPVVPETCADGIAVGNPVSGAMVLRDIRETGGGFVAVPDEALFEAIRAAASHAGIVPEPAAAAGLAGLQPAIETGLVDPNERVVILITGSGLKTPRFLRPVQRSHTIRAGLDELREVLG